MPCVDRIAMRFVLVILIWVVLIGGLRFYTLQRDTALPAAASSRPMTTIVEAEIELLVTFGFAIEDDPFALRIDTQPQVPLLIRFNGTPLATPSTTLSRGTPLRFTSLPGIRAGTNEVFVTASPPSTESHLEHPVRIQVLHGQRVLADRTVWSAGGSQASGAVEFTVVQEDGHAR